MLLDPLVSTQHIELHLIEGAAPESSGLHCLFRDQHAAQAAPAAKAPGNQLLGVVSVAHLCLCPWNIGSPQLLLQADLKPIVLAVPLLERGGINLHDGILHQRLCAHLQEIGTTGSGGRCVPGLPPEGQWQQAGGARSPGTVGRGMFTLHHDVCCFQLTSSLLDAL